MASEKNITMKEFNGTDYDTLYPKTKTGQVVGLDGYIQSQTSGIYLRKNGDTMTGVLNMNGNRISNLGTPQSNNDAVTKQYVDSRGYSVKKQSFSINEKISIIFSRDNETVYFSNKPLESQYDIVKIQIKSLQYDINEETSQDVRGKVFLLNTSLVIKDRLYNHKQLNFTTNAIMYNTEYYMLGNFGSSVGGLTIYNTMSREVSPVNVTGEVELTYIKFN